ncbi:LysR family transcriptional regulator [Clostridium transplantifaecale]|uniref:LysR family transcriptional regulator n=1 Tax=Clostridium transplantifaecale TaxID=2479838 RepID=UPI000F63D9C1|nr:LysR family transcriptional regulator [Clostridium transplantifaecale]
MTMDDLEIFLSIYRCKNITKAAVHQFISQSALSKRLRQLENELGIDLFIRNRGQSCIPTPAGESLAEIASQILLLYEQAQNLKYREGLFSLSIACINSVQEYLLPPLIHSLQDLYPTLHVTLEDHHTNEIFSLVEDKIVEIGITHAPAPFSDLKSEMLYEESYRVVMRKTNNSPAPNTRIHPSMLSPKDEIYEDFGNTFKNWHETWWKMELVKNRVNVTHTAERYLQKEKSWIILPTSIAHELEERSFISYDLDVPCPKHEVYVVYHNRLNNAFAPIFIDEIKKYFVNMGS